MSETKTGLLKAPVLNIYTRIQGYREFIPLPVVRDENATCCTITSALFTSFELELVSDPVEDGPPCCHTSAGARAVEVIISCDTITYPMAFCVVEGSDMVAVMTGREGCWSQPDRSDCIAGVSMLWEGEEEEEIMRRNEEEDERRMKRECEEERLRLAAELQAITARDRARREEQRKQQEQAQQAQAEAQAEPEQAQAGQQTN
ncbi:hypothetical protein AYL99_02233 [Fonsecaea erecta]|uniref:Uncharacterized protein n=1 Tax=Fonsecaea erecta TaxID=1367422 RepID=A0A178ZU35_9EURO|nr:hypothetical protein AYL99_02233 [Fonsecaea erecta]OAP63006.1 hypothetical protein AYL99_02233 [Fonsecaea erecta]